MIRHTLQHSKRADASRKPAEKRKAAGVWIPEPWQIPLIDKTPRRDDRPVIQDWDDSRYYRRPSEPPEQPEKPKRGSEIIQVT